MKDKKQNSLFNSDAVTGFWGIAFGLWWLYMSVQLPAIEVQDGTPSPGTFPIGLSVLLIVLSVLLVFTGIHPEGPCFDFKSIPMDNRIKIVLSLALFIVFLLVWVNFHYIPASFLLCMGLALLYKMNPLSGFLLSLVFSVGTYFVFTKVLLVMLDVAH